MNKQQLLNRRSRLSDMLAHLEASRNNSLPSGDVEALLTVDEIVEFRRRTKAAADDLKGRLDAMGVKDWISHAGLTATAGSPRTLNRPSHRQLRGCS